MFFTCQLARSVTQLTHHIAAHPAVLRDQPLVAGPAVIQGQQAWLSATRQTSAQGHSAQGEGCGAEVAR